MISKERNLKRLMSAIDHSRMKHFIALGATMSICSNAAGALDASVLIMKDSLNPEQHKMMNEIRQA